MAGPGRGRALASLVVLASLLAAGCASVAGATGVRSALGQSTTGVVGEFIPATIAQVADGTDLQQTISILEKELFEDCIKGYGFGPQAQAFAFQSLNLIPFQAMSGYTQNQNAQVGLIDVRSVTRTGMLAPIYIMASRPDASGIPPAEQAALRADQWHCWSKSLQPVRRLDQLGFALQRQWYAQEVRLLNSTQVRAANRVFGSCVTHAGAPRTASESLGQFLNWLQGMVNRAVFASRIGGVQPLLQPRQRIDAHWSAVFIRCGGPLVLLLQRLLPVAQHAFIQDHYGQVTALETAATQTVDGLERMTEIQF
jgi:hypothetical protein